MNYFLTKHHLISLATYLNIIYRKLIEFIKNILLNMLIFIPMYHMLCVTVF
jgi:hypothetical protein